MLALGLTDGDTLALGLVDSEGDSDGDPITALPPPKSSSLALVFASLRMPMYPAPE